MTVAMQFRLGAIINFATNLMRDRMPQSHARFVAADGKSTYLPLLSGEELMVNSRNHLTLKFRGEKLDKKDDFFGSSDSFIRIFRPTHAGGLLPIAESNIVENNLNPSWQPMVLSLDALCRGDMDVPLLFEVWDYDKHKENDLIGIFEASANQLIAAADGKGAFPLFNAAQKAKKSGYRNSGLIIVSLDMDALSICGPC
jgi:hypothetical protein